MDYPFLYSFALSVLQKLDQCNLNEFGNPDDMKKDVDMLKGILNHLPSILETHDLLIRKSKTHVDAAVDDRDAEADVVAASDVDDDDAGNCAGVGAGADDSGTDADTDDAGTDADDASTDADTDDSGTDADTDDVDADDDNHDEDDDDQHHDHHRDDFGAWIIFGIQKSVFDLHDLLNEQLHPNFKSSWKGLVARLTKFHDFKYPESSKKEENLLSSLSVALPEIESQEVNKLPVHLVPCLAYCALYPRSKRIVRETLVNQWMAEGFLELQRPSGSPISGDLELEEIGNRYFMELLSMGVFVKPLFGFGGNSANQQDVTVYSCEIHHEMHELACQMAHKEVWVIDSLCQDYHFYINERTRRCTMYIALHEGLQWLEEDEWIQISDKLKTGMIRTCLFFIRWIREGVLERIISDLSELQILDLGEIKFEKLPASLNKTGKLHYLAFSFNNFLKRLENMNWSSIQTLAVNRCVQLEKVNLEHTNNMRHLYYTSKETNLEVHTLTLRILQLALCSELRSFSLRNSADFTSLRRLRIFECPRLVSLPDSIDLLAHVEELVFHNCARLDLNLGRSMDSLPSLQYMELIGLPKLTGLPTGVQSARALHYLMVADCKSLRSMDQVLQHLSPLQKLRVYDCPNLSITPNVFQSLTALQSLDIRKCPEIAITSTSDARKDQSPFFSHISEIIIDGHQLLDQTPGSSKENVAAIEPQMPSFGAQTDSLLPRNLPQFILNLESSPIFNSSKGMLFQEYKLKVPSRWLVLARALKAIVNLRILQQRKLYCRLFPSDYEFERNTLFQLWYVRGFLPEHWEHLSNTCFNHLLKENCIYESRIDISTGTTKYKVNVGKFTEFSNRFKIKDSYTLIKDEDTRVEGSTSWHHVSVVSKNIDKVFQTLEELQTLKKIKLRSVLFLRDYGSSLKQIPSTFFKAPQYMQALDLSGSHVSELPSSIGEMTDLHFLDLSFTLIETIPESIHLLTELHTLKLKGCRHLYKLPKAMKELVNLYHLEFDVLSHLTSMPKGLGSLTKLRTLSAFIVSDEDGCRLEELKGMNNLCGSLCISRLGRVTHSDGYLALILMKKTRLSQLHLMWNIRDNNDPVLASSILEYLLMPCLYLAELQSLQISNYPGLLPCHEYYFGNLVSITFCNCGGIKYLWLGVLHNLSHLNIYEMSKAIDIGGIFPKLKTLTIEGMPSLERLYVGEEGQFQHLLKVSIRDCPILIGLPCLPLGSSEYLELSRCENFQSLPEGAASSLKTLIINSCPLLSARCAVGGADWEKIEHVPNILLI